MAYFVFSDGRNTFVVQLTDPAKIAHARGLIDGTVVDSAHIGGIVTVGPADYNIGWSYHLAPDDVSFYDMSAEIGDAPIYDVEEFVNSGRPLDENLPHNSWGSWATYVVRELNEVAGTETADLLRGTQAADIIFGHAGNDRVLGAEGHDFIVGGTGDDRLEGEAGHDKLGGGDGNDILIGGSGNDVLDGGLGTDRMFGGLGNDVFLIDSLEERIFEYADGGIDMVKSHFSYTLRTYFEQLKLVGADDIDGHGNSADNVLMGNAGDNRLWGLDGNDILYGDGGDVRVESGNDMLFGGAGDDRLYGGSGNDRLEGGVGADRLFGGSGDDIYIVSDSTDFAYEFELDGDDRVYASVSHRLRDHVERLDLTGAANLNGIGNFGDNVIVGNAGANRLSGLDGRDRLIGGVGNDILFGGTGNDQLTGGAGADKFVFDTGLDGRGNVDRIIDFNVADDRIILDQSVFGAFASLGKVAAGSFVLGHTAQDEDDYILYDSSTGRIYYDADGSGAGAAVLFATVAAGTGLTASDFTIGG